MICNSWEAGQRPCLPGKSDTRPGLAISQYDRLHEGRSCLPAPSGSSSQLAVSSRRLVKP